MDKEEGRYRKLLGNHYETQALIYLIFGFYADDNGHSVVALLIFAGSIITFIAALYIQHSGRKLIKRKKLGSLLLLLLAA